MLPFNFTELDGFYRVGKTVAIGDGQTLVLGSSSAYKHKAVMLRNQDTVGRRVTVFFYGDAVGAANNSVVLVIPGSTATLIQPYIVPARIERITIELLEGAGSNGIRVSLLN